MRNYRHGKLPNPRMKTFHIRPFGITIVCGDAVVASISDEGLGLLAEASESRSVILNLVLR